MAVDLTFPVREETVGHLRASTPLIALVAGESIYGRDMPPNPSYPHVRYGEPFGGPLEYTCQNGSTHSADIHVFAETEKQASDIAAEVVASLDEAELDLGGGRKATVRWTGLAGFRDPEDERLWHEVRTFEFEAG